MNQSQRDFLSEVEKLKSTQSIDQSVLQRFSRRIEQGNLTREDNPIDHLCSFFIPFHKPSKKVFLGHHIKANDWIPPGGHIDRREMPVDTVYREFVEELNFKLTDEKVELFDLTIKPIINNPRHNCKLHYDFWHVVSMKDKVDFKFTRSEFYDARWMRTNEAQKLMKLPDYRAVVIKLLRSSFRRNFIVDSLACF